MILSITTLGLMAVGAASQANNAISGYEYVGCVAVPDLTPVRSYNPDVPALSPITCQEACPSDTDMVFVGAGCHCVSSPMDGWYKIDESKCSAECGKAVNRGFCGGGPEYDPERNIFIIPHNLYRKVGGSTPAAPTPAATPLAIAAATPVDPIDYTTPVPTPNNYTGPYYPQNTLKAGTGCASGSQDCPYASAGFKNVARGGVMAAMSGSILGLLLAGLW